MRKIYVSAYQTPSEVAKALSPFVNQNRSAAKNSIDDAAVSNTVNDLSGADRETSVEGPLSELSLDAQPSTGRNATEPHKTGKLPESNTIRSANRRSVVQKRSSRVHRDVSIDSDRSWSDRLFRRHLAAGKFNIPDPNGTIVVEKMPADAEVLVDGRKLEITWNAGKDKAEISIEAGSHQLRVVNQGNEIFGDRVSVMAGNSTVVKLSMIRDAE